MNRLCCRMLRSTEYKALLQLCNKSPTLATPSDCTETKGKVGYTIHYTVTTHKWVRAGIYFNNI